MRRRGLLSVVGACALAGCLGRDEGDDDETPTPSPTADEPRLVDQSLETLGVECGNEYGRIETSTDGLVVTVRGTIGGNDTCYVARLAHAEYDSADDELYAVVESIADDDAEVCNPCLVEIDYRATFEFENGTPEAVTVDHDGLGESTEEEDDS